MSRPRKPNEYHELAGSWQKNPNRRRNSPKNETPLGTAPRYFEADERACWREIVKHSIPGVLTAADRWLVETACLVMARQRRREHLSGPERASLQFLLSHAGMTPLDRTRLSVPAPEPDADDFAEFY